MAQRIGRTSGVPLDDKVMPTVMAIREHLMQYFKGTCVSQMTVNNVVMASRNLPNRFQYQRQLQDRQRPASLQINGLPLLEVQRSPDKLIFNDRVFDRSPQFRKVRQELESFLSRYLGAMKVEHSDKEIF